GLGISNRVGHGFSTGWTAGYAADSGAFCGNVRSAAAVAAVRIINAGPTPFSPNMGFLVWPRPMLWPVNPLEVTPSDGEPDAGEPPVRFGGRGDLWSSLPLSRLWLSLREGSGFLD